MGLHRSKVWAIAKGFRGRAKSCYRLAKQQAEKALLHAFRHRREKKREVRHLWIARINAGSREHGVKYSHLMHGLRESNVQLNRKTLSELAIFEPGSFRALVDTVRAMRGPTATTTTTTTTARGSQQQQQQPPSTG